MLKFLDKFQNFGSKLTEFQSLKVDRRKFEIVPVLLVLNLEWNGGQNNHDFRIEFSDHDLSIDQKPRLTKESFRSDCRSKIRPDIEFE